MSGEFHKPLIQDAKAFLKAQPYICVKCKKFTDTLRYYCENCGDKNSLRKATTDDYEQYVKNKLLIVQNQVKEQKSIQKLETKPKSKDLIYKCDNCGIKLPSAYKFCPSCGSKLYYENCRGCGRELPIGYKFCPSCGLNLIHEEEPLIKLREQLVPIPKELQPMSEDLETTQNIQEDQLIPISEDTQTPSEDLQLIPTKQKKKYKLTFYECKFCGMKLSSNATFCIQCGTIIKNKL
ncbi:MAG: zinc ribbon domain-containing protein [Promethearchaeota archaeon]